MSWRFMVRTLVDRRSLILNNLTEADSDLVCQAGARWMDINEMLKEKGIPLFFPVSNLCFSFFVSDFV